MIKLGDDILTDVIVSEAVGLFDFPQLKQNGTNWLDEDYTEALDRLKDYQYDVRKITLDCIVSAEDWTALNVKLNTIKAALNYDGLKMLCLFEYSNRGYMVKLSKSTIFNPFIYFSGNRSVAEFKIIFEEPQPFNLNFAFVFITSGTYGLNFIITKTSKGLSFGSLEQKFITVHFDGETTDVNLEQEDYIFNDNIEVIGGQPVPLVVTGDIDSVEDIAFLGYYPEGIDTADYFLRNGTITIP